MKQIFEDFHWKIYEWKMKNPWKSCNLLFRVHRVYGIQNGHLNLTINEFLTVWKMQYYSKRYQQICEMKTHEKCKYLLLQCIVFQTVQNSLIVRSRQSFWITYTLWTQKMGEDFFMDFSLFTHRLFVKSLQNYFTNGESSRGIWN